MLQESRRLLLDELRHHVAEDRSHGVEALVCRTDVVETVIVEKNLLHNKDGHSLAQLRSRLHDAQAERDDLGRKQEVDDLG